MEIPECTICRSPDWLFAWAGVLRCLGCGALYHVRTGRVVPCSGYARPAAGAEGLEVVSGRELERMLAGGRAEAAESVAAGVERPEGWVYP
jgi:hypothetical protein